MQCIINILTTFDKQIKKTGHQEKMMFYQADRYCKREDLEDLLYLSTPGNQRLWEGRPTAHRRKVDKRELQLRTVCMVHHIPEVSFPAQLRDFRLCQGLGQSVRPGNVK